MRKIEYTCKKTLNGGRNENWDANGVWACKGCPGHFDPLNEPVCANRPEGSTAITYQYYTGFMSRIANWFLKTFNKHMLAYSIDKETKNYDAE